MSRVHIVGAGLAGLACAVRLARRGNAVTLYEASSQAGGRCRSYVDNTLERSIDNGNHLLLSGNRSALEYLEEIGGTGALVGPDAARFPFVDVESGAQWTVRPNAGPIPWWLLMPHRRVPGTRLWHYLSALRLATAGPEARVADTLGRHDLLYDRFWEPFAVAALNTPADAGAASLLWRVLRETFARGEAACRPLVARDGLSAAFVAPALETLGARGARIEFGRRLRQIEFSGAAAVALAFGDTPEPLATADRLVLALPPAGAGQLLPGLAVPRQSHAIVNAHFRLSEPPALPGGLPFVGLIGGTAQWLFARGDVVSVTVSAADALAGDPAETVATRIWHDVARVLARPEDPLPPFRIVKERRATFAQTPAGVRRRPATRTRFANVLLAGDWIDTGLPATIESAVRSGHMAAQAAGQGT